MERQKWNKSLNTYDENGKVASATFLFLSEKHEENPCKIKQTSIPLLAQRLSKQLASRIWCYFKQKHQKTNNQSNKLTKRIIMGNATISLSEYLDKNKTFVIPNYQRGYVWGKNKTGNVKDSVSYILEDSIIPGFESKKDKDIFMQGITVSETNSDIILIDGQQRTTFFFLLLSYLGCQKPFNLRYDIREESNKFLSTLSISNIEENPDEEFQDIYFFKKTLRLIDEKLKCIDKSALLEYLLNKVKFLYVVIPESSATKVFSMMNGNKAVMKQEELIKAEVLRLASLSDYDNHTKEWESIMLRSRYAREWDKWLQWWNREDVKNLYSCKNVMGLLIITYLKSSPNGINTKDLTFESFRDTFLAEQKTLEAKKTFDGLRRLQKRFEDAFSDPIIYNYIGAILRVKNKSEQASFIEWYFAGNMRTKEALYRYFKLSFLELSHKEGILQTEENEYKEVYAKKMDEILVALSDNNLYLSENKDRAFNLLLRLNIEEDNKQINLDGSKGRKFNFGIWNKRSLEHIFPKSKVYHIDNDDPQIYRDGNNNVIQNIDSSYINRDDCIFEDMIASEHSIGNLVLLYGSNNSSFGNKSFEEKKEMFFNPEEKEIFESRHLLHTIFKFAGSSWTGEDIAKNKKQVIENFVKYYKGMENDYYGK